MQHQSNLVELGQFIRERRKGLGLTQTALGARLGWAQERVSVLEHGKYGLPSLPQLCRLADALELSLEDLLHHAGVYGTPTISATTPGSEGPAPASRFGRRMTTLFGEMEGVEERLHQAEQELVKAESLRASIRAQRQQMADLLASYREA